MKIVATKDFPKDYYDSFQQFGQDDELVYYRTPKIIKDTSNKLKNVSDLRKMLCYSNLKVRLIGFCGVIYTEFSMYTGNKTYIVANSLFELRKLDKKLFDTCMEFVKYKGKYEKFLAELEETTNLIKNDKILLSYFDLFNTPIFIYTTEYYFNTSTFTDERMGVLKINPCLKDTYFPYLVSASDAYQKLNMYFANLARPFKPMVEIADTFKIVKAGFDIVSSFRKPKQN